MGSQILNTMSNSAQGLTIPTDYIEGYAKARKLAPDVADNYLAHSLIGDPLGDAMMEDLGQLPAEESSRLIEAAMQQEGDSALKDAPASLLEFFRDAEEIPEWVNFEDFAPGVRMFHRNSPMVLAAFVAGTLIEGFATNISKSFFITGRVRDQGIRRLGQNNRHIVEIFFPNGMQRHGDGWKLSVRIRIVHAQVRRLLKLSEDWDQEAWGEPLSAAHMGYAIAGFSARLLNHMKTLGAQYSDEEYDSFMAVWRYSGHLMGIPDTILYRDAEEALKLLEIGGMCEPECPLESVVMANALVNSAPLLVGITEPKARQRLASYVYRVSRCLIGDELADALHYPDLSTFGVLRYFRLTQRYGYLLDRILPIRRQNSDHARFMSLLEVSIYDHGGISYALPDNAHVERSSHY